MFFFRRIIKQVVLTALIGFVIRKLMSADDPRLKKAGEQANRLVGNAFGIDATGQQRPRRRRSLTRSAGSAVVGGALGYFFDPQNGYDRRSRAKTMAKDRFNRNGTSPAALPAAKFEAGPAKTTPATTN